MRMAVLASHEGSLLQAVIDACASGRLPATVVLVVSNNSNSGAIRRATAAGIPTRHLSRNTHPDPNVLDEVMTRTLIEHGAELVLLAGYMRPLGPTLLQRFRGRLVNTHPALLPKYGGHGFYGRRVHETVLAAGETETGASIHLVEADYDSGPVIAQRKLRILPNETADSLEARVKRAERALLIETLARLAHELPTMHTASSVDD